VSFAARWTDEARGQFEGLRRQAERARATRKKTHRAKTSKQEGLFKQVSKTLRLLLDDPRHPGLRTHEYHSLPHPFKPDGKVFEAYAQHRTPGAYRVFWCYGPGKGEMTILAITPHP
jgi:hypothetical protein